ncbi:MAG: beta-ketoacyl-ACP synthase II [Dehalococcoidia bacterium]|nr:beta-ketoacyl-ACP synthase II [Dehalococcoidia bacterium]
MSNTNHRVVITGIGMLTPLGLDSTSTWQALIAGESGIASITHFDTSRHKTKIAGEVKGFEPASYMSIKEAKRMDRFAQMAVAAAKQALAQSKLVIDSSNAFNIGVIIGSGIGGINTLLEQARVLIDKGPERLSPFTVPMMTADVAAGHVSIMLGAKGPNFCTMSACASGSDAIGIAYEMIKRGDVSAIFAGGAEAAINPIGIAGFNALKGLSTNNENPLTASRPFDATRDGFIMSEGSAVLLLESAEHALQREANIIAEIVSYGASADAYHMTQPAADGEGGLRSMKSALTRADLAPDKIDYINAHGTSTQLNDKMETRAIKSVFKNCAYKIPISSTKSMTGHLLGAAGALEAAFCAIIVNEGIIPPTINLHTPDPDCDLDYVPNHARRQKVSFALSNAFGFGGHNSTLIIGRYSEALA